METTHKEARTKVDNIISDIANVIKPLLQDGGQLNPIVFAFAYDSSEEKMIIGELERATVAAADPSTKKHLKTIVVMDCVRAAVSLKTSGNKAKIIAVVVASDVYQSKVKANEAYVRPADDPNHDEALMFIVSMADTDYIVKYPYVRGDESLVFGDANTVECEGKITGAMVGLFPKRFEQLLNH